MKITMLFVFASLFVNSAAFAVGPDVSSKCKGMADKIRAKKDAEKDKESSKAIRGNGTDAT